MSYNREIRDNIKELNEYFKEFFSTFGTINETLLQHSELLRRSVQKEKEAQEENEASNQRERKKRQELEDIRNEEHRLANRRLALEQARAENTEKIANKVLKAEEERLLEEEENLKRRKELFDIEEQYGEDVRQQHENRKAINDQITQAEKEAREKQIQAEKEAREKQIQTIKNYTNNLAKLPEDLINTFVTMQKKAVDSVYSAYQQNASKLSALLDSSVQDISKLQKSIASSLRDTSLNKAISNIQVLNEATSLAAAGYTNESKIQQSATDISIAKQIAPTMDFDNKTVKNLTNVFGSDFIHKFAGIASSVQDSAGSLVGMQTVLNSLITDLEPVFLNAELQSAALQGAGDVTATLTSAMEQGIISESNIAQYRAMIVELMDPSKALTSSNIAVRNAAMNYDYSSADPAQALQAILSATKNIQGNFNQSMSSTSIISRSLGASVFGLDSMTAAYNPNAYTDVNMIRIGNLEDSYDEQVNKLSKSAYTTKESQEKNVLENSGFTQAIAGFAKDFPILYQETSKIIIASINAAGSGLTKRLSDSFFGNKTGGTIGADGEVAVNGNSNGLLGKLSSAATTKSGHQFIGSRGLGLISANSAKGLGQTGSMLNNITGANLSGLGAVAVGTGAVVGGANLIGYATNKENADQSGWEKASFGGDVGQSIGSYAAMGAGVGALVGTFVPVIGNVIGTAIGGLVGAVAGLGVALVGRHEQEKRYQEALEAQTQATKDLLGEGIKPLTEVEKAQANRGADATMQLGSNTFSLENFDSSKVAAVMSSNAGGLDFVPYDGYISRLHKGEAVVTAKAAEEYRQSNPQFWRDSKANERVVDKLDEQTNKIVSALVNNKDDNFKPLSSGNLLNSDIHIIANQNA